MTGAGFAVPSKHLVAHPSQLPPEVKQALDAVIAQPVDPPAVLVGRGWSGKTVTGLGFAGHIVDLGIDDDGNLRVLTHDFTGHVAIFEARSSFTTVVLVSKNPRFWVRLIYPDTEAAQQAWANLRTRRFEWYDAVKAGDAELARRLDPLTDWAMAGYPLGPLPESVRQEQAARRAKKARNQKIRLGCCLGIVGLLALGAVGMAGRELLRERERDREYATRAQQFRDRQAAAAYAAAHPPTSELAVEPTMARITPQLASPEAVAFMRALLKDLSERPDADRFVPIDVQYDTASGEQVDAELRRRGSAPLGSQRMWLAVPFSAERITTDVFARLGLPGLRFELARTRGAPPAPRPKLAIRVTERLSSQRYRPRGSRSTYYGIDLVLDVEATIPGRPERLSVRHESPALPSGSVQLGQFDGARSVYEADRQRAADTTHPRIAALFVR